MENNIEKNLKHVHELLAKGAFIEAMETYLHDEVELTEANETPKKGKDFCVQFEQDFIDNQLAEFVGYEVGNYAVQGDHSFYDAQTQRWKYHGIRTSGRYRMERWKDL